MNDLDNGQAADIVEDEFDDELLDFIEDDDNRSIEGAIEDIGVGDDDLLEHVIPAIEEWEQAHSYNEIGNTLKGQNRLMTASTYAFKASDDNAMRGNAKDSIKYKERGKKIEQYREEKERKHMSVGNSQKIHADYDPKKLQSRLDKDFYKKRG